MKITRVVALFLLIAFSVQATPQKYAKHRPVCPLCECNLAYDDCHKACASDRRREKICDMECVDFCHHSEGGKCPMRKKA